jgi:Zn-dependent protease
VYSDPDTTSEQDKYPNDGYDAQAGAREDMTYAHPEYYQWHSAEHDSSSDTPNGTQYGSEARFSDPYNAQERDRYYAAHVWREDLQQEQRGDPSWQNSQYQPADVKPSEQPGTEQPGSAQSQQQGSMKKKLTGLGGALAALGAWLLKFKSLAFLLKFGVAGFSAFVSIFFYSLIFGWTFAIGIVASLFLHEMGHAVVMKLKGIPVGGLIFIPMLGAAVTMRQVPHNAKDEAEVAIAGPLAGAIAASICLWLGYQHPASLWAPLAYFGFFINLFNLIPIVPFDGGRVLAAVDRRVWLLGFLALLGYLIWTWINCTFNSFLLIFVFLAAMQLWSRGLRVNNDDVRMRAYYSVPLSSRISITVLYFGLAAILFLGMTMAHQLMPITQ